MGDFAKGFGDREDYWREQKRKDQSSLASAATTLNNYIRQNPQATEADIAAFGKKIYPNGGSEALLGTGGTARAAALNAEKNARTKKTQQRADATADYSLMLIRLTASLLMPLMKLLPLLLSENRQCKPGT